MLILLALLIHLTAIATLFPDIASQVEPGLDAIVAIQFPLMGLAVVAHTVWEDEERLRSRLARLSLALGITYLGLLMFRIFGVSIGPADPFGAPASASFELRVGWFVGFSIITTIGTRFFFAKPILDIAAGLSGPMRRAARAWRILAVIVGAAAGAAAIFLLHSAVLAKFTVDAQDRMEADPGFYSIAFLVVPVVLGLVLGLVGKGVKRLRGKGTKA